MRIGVRLRSKQLISTTHNCGNFSAINGNFIHEFLIFSIHLNNVINVWAKYSVKALQAF